MVANRERGSLGANKSQQRIDQGTTNRWQTNAPIPSGKEQKAASVLERIRRFRDVGSGMYPQAVAALDHYLDKTGTFVEIGASKVKSVRQEAEADHVQKAKAAFHRSALLEAAVAWLNVNGYPSQGGKLTPPQVDVKLEWQSGVETGGLTDDNLTYYGSAIFSEVVIKVKQTTIPQNSLEGPVEFELSVVSWKSWVVDNYDWEGEKQFGGIIASMLGLPTQREMNSLQVAGLAKSYQRSSRSWENINHGLQPWRGSAGSLQTMREIAPERIKTKQRRESQRKKELADGALPPPRPAEEM